MFLHLFSWYHDLNKLDIFDILYVYYGSFDTIYWIYGQIVFENHEKKINFFISYSIFLLCNIILKCRHIQQQGIMISTNLNLRYLKMPPWWPQPTTRDHDLNNPTLFRPISFWEKKIAKRYFSIYSCFVPSFGAITNSSSKG